jgi:4-fold beta flower protein
VGTIWLFEHGTGRPFAFSSDGGRTWFTQDGRPWAWAADNGWLWSYATSQALGWFSDKTFFAPNGKALYFKST